MHHLYIASGAQWFHSLGEYSQWILAGFPMVFWDRAGLCQSGARENWGASCAQSKMLRHFQGTWQFIQMFQGLLGEQLLVFYFKTQRGTLSYKVPQRLQFCHTGLRRQSCFHSDTWLIWMHRLNFTFILISLPRQHRSLFLSCLHDTVKRQWATSSSTAKYKPCNQVSTCFCSQDHDCLCVWLLTSRSLHCWL